MILSPSTELARRRTLPLILALAAAYFLLGRLALLLAIPPGFASSVWPAAGVALMALLLAGRRLWPGVLLGSFLVNFSTTFRTMAGDDLLVAAAVPAAIGGGAALQAVLGASAIRRWVVLPNNLSRSVDIFWLLTLGGPLSCVVSATVGVVALVAGGAIVPAEVTFHWWTWWVGDSIGVLVVVPMVLAFVAEPSREGGDKRWRIGLPILITCGAVVTLFAYARDQERRQLELELNRHALSLAYAFEKHSDRSLDDLMSIEGLFAGSQEVTRQEFGHYARRILERNPTFQALSWNPRLRHAERSAYEAAGRADGFVDYRFTEAAQDGGLRPAAKRPDYIVVHYIEPYAGNERALGFDIASDPSRRAAAWRARDSGRPAATPGVRLVQETGEQTGVLILMPVYAGGVRPQTVADRRRLLVGFATGVLRVGDALRTALADLPREGFVVTLLDRSAPPGEALLAQLEGGAVRDDPGRLEWSFDHDLGGRLWSLRLAPTPELLASHQRWYAWAVLAGGLGLVSLLGVLLLVQSGRASELAVLNARLEEGIDRRRRLEAQRERLIADLELRNAELERFSYTVSHDLKSPLITIKGFLGLLERDLAADRKSEVGAQIAQLNRSADRMRELIDDLLDLSRAGRVTGTAEALALDELAREAVAHVAGDRLDGAVHIAVAPDLPRVTAHRGQVLEVFQNLLDNAIKFTRGRDDPRIEIGAEVEGDRVVCWVRDNGVGIDPAHHERIFGLFNRLDHSSDGTGIGLALVRRIVEVNGGSVWVESAGQGRGSTFYFALPGVSGGA